MTPEAIYHEAYRRGLYLSYWNEAEISVDPAEKCDLEFERLLLEHKPLLIPWLKKRAANWLHLCRQIIEGEFDHADAATIRRLDGGLTGNHPLRMAARKRLHQFQNHDNRTKNNLWPGTRRQPRQHN